MKLPARAVALLALVLAVAALLLLLVSGPGYRLEVWEFRTGFSLMRWAAFIGLAAAALGLVALVIPKLRRAGVFPAIAALVLGLLVAYVPWSGLQTVRSVPPIHDISTDTVNPPPFVVLLPQRLEAPNGAEYAGESIAEQQRAAYPDLQPRLVDATPAATFARALAAAEAMGWEIAAAEESEGRIEATDTTLWFGFKDDVVIRIQPAGQGSVLDVRSMSRLGGSDVGANAKRIRRFLERFDREG